MSNRSMSPAPTETDTAQVIDLGALFLNRRRAAGATHTSSGTRSATLMSIKQSLRCCACVSIEEGGSSYSRQSGTFFRSGAFRKAQLSKVRRLLEAEFGPLRVCSNNGLLVVRHRYVEQLIAGLLRAQYAARNPRLPETGISRTRPDATAGIIVISWGVGSTLTEARSECLQLSPE